jgi:hypothetical protein
MIGRNVYLTDISTSKRVPLNEDGEPGAAQTLYQATTVLDDLEPYCDGLLVADFIRGLRIYITLDGSVVRESSASFVTPSVILADATPFLDEREILLTLSGGAEESSPGGRVISLSPEAVGLPSCARCAERIDRAPGASCRAHA